MRARIREQLRSAAFLARVQPKPNGCRVEARRTFKALFRELCLADMPIFRRLPLPDPPSTRTRHALLLEFRPLPHVEAIVRNAMFRLGPSWAHTIVCGPDNADMMRALAPPGVQVLCLAHARDMTLPRYNELLTSAAFWEGLDGEHLLVHQEDSFIFRSSDLTAFLGYDYVGAPWRDGRVGNGGFSLRRRSAMIRLCRAAGVCTRCPEDLHFDALMRAHGARVAPLEVARRFAMENVPHDAAIAGHQWWWAHRPSRWAELVWRALDAADADTPSQRAQPAA